MHQSSSDHRDLSRESDAFNWQLPWFTERASCISEHTRVVISHIECSIGTLRMAKRHIQLPCILASKYNTILGGVFPEDRHRFGRAISSIGTNISEWVSRCGLLTSAEVAADPCEAAQSPVSMLLFTHWSANYVHTSCETEFGLSPVRGTERPKSSSKVPISANPPPSVRSATRPLSKIPFSFWH